MLPPSSRALCRFRRHSRLCCCLEGVQHRRLMLHTPASSSLARPTPGRGLVRAEHLAPGRGLMPTPDPACLPSPARFSLPTPAPTPPRPGLRHLSLYQVGELTASAPCQPPRTAASVPTSVSFSASAGAMSAPTSPALRGPRQPRLPRRPTCSPMRSSNRRNRAIQRRPVPVRWSARKDTPSDKAGISPQASGPPILHARSPGRSGLSVVGRPAPADGPRRPPPTETRSSRVPAALPARLSPCRRWSPRPWSASRLAPELPPLAAPRSSP